MMSSLGKPAAAAAAVMRPNLRDGPSDMRSRTPCWRLPFHAASTVASCRARVLTTLPTKIARGIDAISRRRSAALRPTRFRCMRALLPSADAGRTKSARDLPPDEFRIPEPAVSTRDGNTEPLRTLGGTFS